jgi:hypothetical protein
MKNFTDKNPTFADENKALVYYIKNVCNVL